jgi:hypothetical protein
MKSMPARMNNEMITLTVVDPLAVAGLLTVHLLRLSNTTTHEK